MAVKRPAPAANERGAASPEAPPPGATADAPADGDVVPKVRRAVHDLRQPVQAMRLFVHLLGTRLEREEDRALIVKLDEALENIEAALRALMTSITPAPSAAPGETAPPTLRS